LEALGAGSVVDTLITEAHNINVYLLEARAAKASLSKNRLKKCRAQKCYDPVIPGSCQAALVKLGWALITTGCASLLAWIMSGKFELANLVMVYLLGVVFMAARFAVKHPF